MWFALLSDEVPLFHLFFTDFLYIHAYTQGLMALLFAQKLGVPQHAMGGFPLSFRIGDRR